MSNDVVSMQLDVICLCNWAELKKDQYPIYNQYEKQLV